MGKPSHDCPLAPAIKLLSGAWTLEILFFLRSTPHHFGELKRELGSISSKVLTDRLRELQKRGVVTREVIDDRPPRVRYSLTDAGARLLPVLDTLSDVNATLQSECPWVLDESIDVPEK